MSISQAMWLSFWLDQLERWRRGDRFWGQSTFPILCLQLPPFRWRRSWKSPLSFVYGRTLARTHVSVSCLGPQWRSSTRTNTRSGQTVNTVQAMWFAPATWRRTNFEIAGSGARRDNSNGGRWASRWWTQLSFFISKARLFEGAHSPVLAVRSGSTISEETFGAHSWPRPYSPTDEPIDDHQEGLVVSLFFFSFRDFYYHFTAIFPLLTRQRGAQKPTPSGGAGRRPSSKPPHKKRLAVFGFTCFSTPNRQSRRSAISNSLIWSHRSQNTFPKLSWSLKSFRSV